MRKETLLFAGDTVPNKPFTFGGLLKQLCAEHNIKVFNLEGAFSKLRKPLFKAGPHILLEPEYFEAVRGCFNVATLANNHAMDFDVEGLETTIQLCKNAGISTVGAGLNLDAAFTPFDTDDCRIISVAENEFGAADANKAGIAAVDRPNEIYELIRQGREAGKFVAVVAHGGTEVIPIPPPYLRQRYKLWVEYGADLVIGNHPHVVQGFEWHKGKAIFYSLGNFFFPGGSFREYPNSDWSIVVSVNITNRDKIGIRIIPARCDGDNVVDIVADNRFNETFAELCREIAADNYLDTYNKIASNLFKSWYPRLSTTGPDDAALLLHYLRCDAHRNLIQTELMRQTGEIRLNNQNGGTDKQTNGPTEQKRKLYEICAEKMLMTPEERRFLQQVLQNKNSYLETGAGYSTIWCSQFVGKVVSVEARKQWFDDIKLCIKRYGIDNIDLHLLPPESCAYYEDGREKWDHRETPEGSDYGLTEEFSTYLKGIGRLFDGNHFDVVLVDGNVRQQVVELLIAKKYNGIVLLHDVTPERDYLNKPILSLEGVKVLNQAGSLAQLSLCSVEKSQKYLSEQNKEPAAKILEFDGLPRRPASYGAGLLAVIKNNEKHKCDAGQDVKTDDVSAKDCFRKGVKQLQAGNYIDALNHFNQAVIACPAMPYTHFGIAAAYAQLGDLVSAHNACQAELSLCPENDDARKLLQRIEEETNIAASIR